MYAFAIVQCILFLDLSLFFSFLFFRQEGVHDKRNSNLLFSISVGYLYIFRKRERTVLMNKERLDIKDKRKKIDFVNHVEKKEQKKRIQFNTEYLINFVFLFSRAMCLFDYRKHDVYIRVHITKSLKINKSFGHTYFFDFFRVP